MSEPALECENNAIFKQNYAQKLFVSFKISYSCRFSLRENLDIPDFLQKKFYNINYWYEKCVSKRLWKFKRSDHFLMFLTFLLTVK